MLITAAQFILSLSILIVLHECGHFFPAKWFNTRVEKFYLFFDPWFSLFKIKKRETEYGIGWLPLGGYVKIAGMIDESMDKEQLKQPPQPWEFRSKKAWQRLIIMLGGVTVNFILGYLIFTMMLVVWGEKYLPNKNASYGIAVDSKAASYGFQNGDKLLSIDGKPLEILADYRKNLLFANNPVVEIERKGQKMEIKLSKEQLGELATYRGDLISIGIPFRVDSIAPKSPNINSGLRKGDIIQSINGVSTPYGHLVLQEISRYRNYPIIANSPLYQSLFPKENLEFYQNKNLDALVLRGNDTATIRLHLNTEGRLDIGASTPDKLLVFETKKYNLGQAAVTGMGKTVAFLGDYVKQFGLMFNGTVKASESLGGFGSIASMFGDTWDWQRFWRMTGILSIILAFMNLLPIPALDGGHVMFLLYEMVSGRKPNEKVQEYAQLIGFALLFGLILYANGMDIYRAIFK